MKKPMLPGFIAGHPARRGRLLVGACVLRPAPACCCSRVCSLPRALSNPTPLPRSRCVCCSASLTVGVLGCAELETSAGGRCAYFCCPCRSLQTELVDFARRLGFCETPLRAPDLHPAPLRPRSGAQPARRRGLCTAQAASLEGRQIPLSEAPDPCKLGWETRKEVCRR